MATLDSGILKCIRRGSKVSMFNGTIKSWWYHTDLSGLFPDYKGEENVIITIDTCSNIHGIPVGNKINQARDDGKHQTFSKIQSEKLFLEFLALNL